MNGPHNLSVDELLALLSDPSLTPAGIAEEMECAGCPRTAPAEVARAREALAKLHTEAVAQTAGLDVPAHGALAEEISTLPEMLGLSLVHAAGRGARQEVLRALATGVNKSLNKEAKRELHRLKSKGVQVQELKPQGVTVLKPVPEAEAPSCYVSSIDAYGERAIWWSRSAKQGVEVVQVVASDLKGILAVDSLGLSRKSYREFVKRLPRQAVVTTAEISREHARQLIAEAEAVGTRNGFSVPASYGAALRLLGPAPAELPQRPGADLDFGPDGELPHQLAGPALFADPLFTAWIPEEDSLRSFAGRVDEIAGSQLYLDAAQKQEAMERSADEAAVVYFTPQRRVTYARRLQEMAHVLETVGRPDAARTALATARALDRGESTPFGRALFTHALESRLAEQPAPKAAPASGLFTP